MDANTLRATITEYVSTAMPVTDSARAALASVPPDVAAKVYPQPLTPAAVLIPLVENKHGLSVLLTQRTDHLKDHPGQISFPGGSLEIGDNGPVDAALRESQEEIGLPRAHVEVIGVLAPHAVITGFAVTPVVGLITREFELRLDEFEVAEVFEVPLAFFLDDSNRRARIREVSGVEFPTFEYQFEQRRIWGATAGMINSFIEIVCKTNV